MSLPDDFPELHQFGTSPKVSDGFEEFLKQTQKLAPTTTESFALEVIRPGRPGDELEDEADGERNHSFMTDDDDDYIDNLKWPFKNIIKNDRFGQPIATSPGNKRLNMSTIFNDRLGEIGDDYSGYDPDWTESSTSDVFHHKRPGNYLDPILDQDGNKVSLGLDDLISNGRPPTILLGTSEDDDDEEDEAVDLDLENRHQHHDHDHHHHDHDHHHPGYGSENEGIENGRQAIDVEEEDQFDKVDLGEEVLDDHKENKTKNDKDKNKDRPKLPSYYPQLTSFYDSEQDSDLPNLRPNFTQTIQSVLASHYPDNGHSHQAHTTKRPITRRTTTTKSTKPTSRPEADIPDEDQEKIQAWNRTEAVDRFSADILDPNPNKSKLTDKNGNKPPSAEKGSNAGQNNAGKVVSLDQWKAILVEKLTSAISKVAASQGLQVHPEVTSQKWMPGNGNLSS